MSRNFYEIFKVCGHFHLGLTIKIWLENSLNGMGDIKFGFVCQLCRKFSTSLAVKVYVGCKKIRGAKCMHCVKLTERSSELVLEIT